MTYLVNLLLYNVTCFIYRTEYQFEVYIGYQITDRYPYIKNMVNSNQSIIELTE